jgi:maltose alpha-D-glucosyltransferase/alpha-amylase
LPVITDPIYNFQSVNVEAQQRSPTSLLNWMKRLIRVRKRYPVFGRGTLEFVEARNKKIVAYVRKYQGQVVLVVNNLSRFAQPAQLALQPYQGMRPVELIGEHEFPAVTEQPYFLTLGPHDFFWFRLEGPPG